MQYAVYHRSVEILAELLENGADIDATTTGVQQTTLLELAAIQRHLDVLRMLLQRGASTDHCDEDDIDVHALCWYSTDYFNKGISAAETANVLGEYVALDSQWIWNDGTILHIAAMFADGKDIDTLVSRGHDVNAKDVDGATPITDALDYENASAYFALLARGADLNFSLSSVEKWLHRAMTFQAQMPKLTSLPFLKEADFESIIRHILQHGSPNLNIAIGIQLDDDDFPPSVRGHSITARQLAEVFGPKTEAWFLTLLLQTGHPHYFTKRDKRRLRALRLDGYAPQGCVLGDDDDPSEDDEIDQSDGWVDKDDGDDYGHDDDHDYDHGGSASSIQDDTTDLGEEEQFWDAEQDL